MPRPRRQAAPAPAIPAQLPGMARKIVMRRVDALIPYARNSRVHTPAQIAQIAASIKEFGFTVPLLTDAEGNVIAGHGRLLAAPMLGMTQVPTIDGSYMTPAQRRAYVIADNKLTENSSWNEELLQIELADLQVGGFELNLLGFSDGELKGLGIGGLGDGGDAQVQQTPPRWAVIVDCVDEPDQIALIARLEGEGRKVRGAVG